MSQAYFKEYHGSIDPRDGRFKNAEPYSFTAGGKSQMTIEEHWQSSVETLYPHWCLKAIDPLEGHFQDCREPDLKLDCRAARCNTCVDLNYDFYPNNLGLWPRRWISTTLYNIKKSATSGCKHCSLLFDGIKRVSTLPESLFKALEGSWLLNEVRISLKIGDAIQVSVFGMRIEFYSHGDSPFAIAQERPYQPTLEYCSKFIKNQLHKCVSEHSACSISTNISRSLPRRVLYLGEETSPKWVKLLVNSSDEIKDYVALSHCWGAPNAVPKTTQANLQSSLEGIRILDLPATFRDAILLTRSLDIKHLWIDSLCIVQDDQGDWEVESSKMAEIYSNATLTIAATGSTGCHGGCLFDRWSSQMNPSRILSMKPIELKAPSNEYFRNMYVRPLPIAHGAFLSRRSLLNFSPALMRRAWAFQERLLSHRIIHFHHEEMIWECMTDLNCECGWETETQRDDEPLKKDYAALLRMDTNSLTLIPRTIESWPKIVSMYSELALTFETDRLPALSGLASRLASPGGLDYLAGLWRSDLERLLGWTRFIPKDESTLGYAERCAAPTPPTWSWASITSTVAGKPHAVCFPTIDLVDNATLETRVIESSCYLAGADHFGAVSGGYILIEGKVISANLRHNHDRGDIHCLSFDDEHRTLFLTDISCISRNPREPEPVQALLLISSQVSLPYGFQESHEKEFPGICLWWADFVLVLRDIGGGKYERVGLAIADKAWRLFEDVSISEITLI